MVVAQQTPEVPGEPYGHQPGAAAGGDTAALTSVLNLWKNLAASCGCAIMGAASWAPLPPDEYYDQLAKIMDDYRKRRRRVLIATTVFYMCLMLVVIGVQLFYPRSNEPMLMKQANTECKTSCQLRGD